MGVIQGRNDAKSVTADLEPVNADLEPSDLAEAGNEEFKHFRDLRLLFGDIEQVSPSPGSRLEFLLHLAALVLNGEAGLKLADPVVSFFPDGCHLEKCWRQSINI